MMPGTRDRDDGSFLRPSPFDRAEGTRYLSFSYSCEPERDSKRAPRNLIIEDQTESYRGLQCGDANERQIAVT